MDNKGSVVAHTRPDWEYRVNRPTTPSMSKAYAPDVFERLTDLLAELLLEDFKQFPQLETLKTIDSVSKRENTAALVSRGRT